MVNGLPSRRLPWPRVFGYPLPQVEYLVPQARLVLVALLSPMGRTKYEPDLWHLHGARHNPFKFGRLTLEIAEPFASVSRLAISCTRAISTIKWPGCPRPPASEDPPAGKRTISL